MIDRKNTTTPPTNVKKSAKSKALPIPPSQLTRKFRYR